MGTTGISVRCQRSWRRQDGSVGKWISVAWIFPPRVSGWSGLTDFTFGYLPFDDSDPPELQKLLKNWWSRFSHDDFAVDVSGKWGAGWRVSAEDAPLHIDTLVDRLEKVLTDLRSLELDGP